MALIVALSPSLTSSGNQPDSGIFSVCRLRVSSERSRKWLASR